MNLLIVILSILSQYGISYDGCQEKKHYFQVNTPDTDYGFVMDTQTKEIYCDLVYTKK
jgi:hypothetical protein